MNRETGVQIFILVGAAFVVAVVIVVVFGAVSSWLVPDDGSQRDVGLSCGPSDPTRYSNVTCTPFESLNETEQQILKPALEEGYVLITDQETAAIDHWFIEYENQTYRCVASIS